MAGRRGVHSWNFQDMTGQVFERLTVRCFVRRQGHHMIWLCDCRCGGTTEASRSNLVSGNTTSCGCYLLERIRAIKTKHGHHPWNGKATKTYECWANMVQRSTNTRRPRQQDYVGRGITVCPWLRQFENFLSLMGNAPLGLSVDRINNDGHYSCGQCDHCLTQGWPMNVRWATRAQQNRNRRNSRWFTFRGEIKLLKEWSEQTGIPYQTLQARFHKWGHVERVLTEPIRSWPGRKSLLGEGQEARPDGHSKTFRDR